MKTLKTVPAQLTAEIIEDHVADAAQVHDEQSGYTANWMKDIEPVSKRICDIAGVEWYGE